MRTTSAATKAAWDSGDFVGDQRPIVRATISRLGVQQSGYPGGQVYTSMIFGQAWAPVELPNLKEVKWARSTDQVATCTLVLYNTEPLPLGGTPVGQDLDQPGAFTYSRGKALYSSRWGHHNVGWADWIVPDRIIRTYEGYGVSPSVKPDDDPHLYLSGTWMIDDVDLDDTGMITVTCRDLSSTLLSQICMPPVVPAANYPLYFEGPRTVVVTNPTVTTITGVEGVSGSGEWFPPCWDSDSNQHTRGHSAPFYPGANFVDPGGAVNVQGHTGYDAMDASESSYWLSLGVNAPSASYSFEWITLKFKPRTLGALRFRCWGGPYHIYLSVMTTDGRWAGSRNIPYRPGGGKSDNYSAIPYVDELDVGAEEMVTHPMVGIVANAWKVRFTFTRLTPAGAGSYRCGFRWGRTSAQVTTHATTTTTGGGSYSYVTPKTKPPRYDDFTDIVKHLLSWGGFHWPREASNAFFTKGSGVRVVIPAPSNDPCLASGRVWGDLQETGTRGVSPLGVSFFDKKPILDVISAIRDMVGFIFYIDDGGGAVFRPPNIWSVGNWIGDVSASAGRTSQVVTVDEEKHLLALTARLSSRSIRERVFVGNLSGQVGAVSPGHNPYPSGLRRVGGWTDQHFSTAKECQIMADLVTLRQLFTYRTDKIKIPGNPAIQVDDQIRIYERVTEEGYLHYVSGISMAWSVETGVYTYDIDTHWLGETPFSNWTFNPATLSGETQYYLKSLGLYR